MHLVTFITAPSLGGGDRRGLAASLCLRLAGEKPRPTHLFTRFTPWGQRSRILNTDTTRRLLSYLDKAAFVKAKIASTGVLGLSYTQALRYVGFSCEDCSAVGCELRNGIWTDRASRRRLGSRWTRRSSTTMHRRGRRTRWERRLCLRTRSRGSVVAWLRCCGLGVRMGCGET